MSERVLITGGAGFIGHHLVEHILKETDWEIVLLDRLSYAGDLNRLADIEVMGSDVFRKRLRFVFHDLRAPLGPVTRELIGNPDYILHLAAESHVDRSIQDPVIFVESNVIGTTNLMIYARSLQNLKKFINFGTDEVFGPAAHGVFHKETDPWRPSNPYSASKAGQSAMGIAFHVTYGLPVINTFTMNNFGERQDPEKYLPKLVRAAVSGGTVTVHGTPGNIGSRLWLHARNTADALLFILGLGVPGEGYNIVGQEELDNLELLSLVSDITDRVIEYEFLDFHATRPGHDSRYALDGTKLREMGWDQPVEFRNSLERTVTWMVNNPRWLGV